MDALAWPLDVLLWPYILHLIVDVFGQYETNREAALSALKWPIIGGVGLILYIETTSRTMGFLLAGAIPKLLARIRIAMFDHVQHHTPHYFNERFAGTLANKINDMTTQVEQIIQQLFWPFVPAIFAAILGAVALWFVNPIFALIWLAWLVVHLTICVFFASKCDRLEAIHGEARSGLIGKIVDSLTNNFAVNLFFRFDYEKNYLNPFQKDEINSNTISKRYVEKMRIVLSCFYFLAIVGIFGSMIHLWVKNQITTGQVVQVFTTMWSLSNILWVVGSTLPFSFQSIGILKQAYTVVMDPSDLGDKSDAQPLKITRGMIEFENVSFQYGEKKLFENKRVKIFGGEKVGLVGYTGAGKSSFINLILRFYPVREGKISIDGQDISMITLESLRRQIALIPQDPLLFHRTLRENIMYGNPDASEQEMKEAARLAHCDSFIDKIPKGYEAKVGERGTKLSGGEKQRIAIARALLANSPILILDEATSSLDSLTESYIQEALDQLMKDRTTLVIAHRLSTLSRMDRILVFNEGRIVEEGKHSDLLAKKGLYAMMWNMQVGGFLPESPRS
jgi:ATP-binding cassette subfamily B protein